MDNVDCRYGWGDHEPVVVASTDGMSRDEWLDLRRSGLGGSDAAPVLGLSRWKSPWEVYQDKKGRLPEVEPTEAMEWGVKLEQIVAEEFTLRTGLEARYEPVLLAHPDHPWMLANVDRFVGDDAILECKTSNARSGADWEEGPPFEAALQANHYLAVTGRQRAYVACLVGGNRFKWFALERDDDLIDMIIEQERAFWEDHIVADVAPEITERATDSAALGRMFQGGVEDPVLLPPGAAELLDERRKLKQYEKTLTEDLTRVENQIKEMLGDHEVGVDADGQVAVTWKRVTTTRFDLDAFRAEHPELVKKYMKPSTSRRFSQPAGKRQRTKAGI